MSHLIFRRDRFVPVDFDVENNSQYENGDIFRIRAIFLRDNFVPADFHFGKSQKTVIFCESGHYYAGTNFPISILSEYANIIPGCTYILVPVK